MAGVDCGKVSNTAYDCMNSLVTGEKFPGHWVEVVFVRRRLFVDVQLYLYF